MKDLLTKFEAYLLTEKCVSRNTLQAYTTDMKQWYSYYLDQGSPELSVELLKKFIYSLDGQHLSARTLSRKISCLKLFFSWLHDRYGMVNHAEHLLFPKLSKRLPHQINEIEIQQLLQCAEEDSSDLGMRNKVIIYLLYVSGMRISELVSLTISMIHFDTQIIHVTGKGNKMRLIPIPAPMLDLMKIYIKSAHQNFTKRVQQSTDYLFPTLYGGKVKPITRQSCWIIIQALWKQSGNRNSISPHMLRHSFATHMLKRGADLRSLQMLLGHETISTVQIYTHVETSFLRDVYDKKHPRS